MSNNFTTRRHLDLADSSSDSEDSQRCLNADVAFEDSNSLVNNEVDTESLGSAENENIADRPANTVDEDEFKAEWTDTFSIHASYLNLNGKVARTQYIGPPHRWKNINWSTLFLLEGMKVGAFIGVDKPRELPPGQTINLRYQYILLDDNNNHIMEGQSTVCPFQHTVNNERVDNGFAETFNFLEFMKHFRKQVVLRSPGATEVPIRLKVLIEEDFRPTIVPVGHHSKRNTGMVGLENLGATCYLNALLQMLYHINGFRRAVYKLPHEGEAITSSTTLALQNVFRNLQTSDREVTTKELTVAFGWTSAEAFLQQDVQEMMRVLVDKLEEKMTGTVVDGYIKRLMAGKVRSYICCVNVQYESKREEDYYDIQLDVKGCRNIYESFRKYITIEMLDGENQYEAGEHGKQDAKKGVIFESFPPVLTIHLKRFDFDLQTFNFTKIHDYYEFPLRLELDQFLAPDCPAEARQQPNVYLLHSVLVHQGDVGGGHYYAYIRPTTETFDYSGNPVIAKPGEPVRVAAGRDQQWFKFNDETVLQVPQREAVDYCYGQRIKEGEFLRRMSSAYMLVYIREGDAPDIMREVTAEDIPAELGERLDTEQAIKKAKIMRAIRSRWFTSIGFATEKQVAEFKEYSRQQDWFTDKALLSAECMRDTNKLGVLLILAEKLGRTPADIRLWEIEKRENMTTLCIGDDIDVDELPHRIKEPNFYVEYVDFCGTAEERIEYEEEYNSLRQAAHKLLADLRGELLAIEELHYAEAEDPVAGCGIGSSNLPLNDLKDFAPEKHEFYADAFSMLQTEMLQLVKRHYQDIQVDQMLVFIKVYDPYNYLSIAQAESSSDESLQSISSGADSDMDIDTAAEAGDAGEAPGSEYVPGGSALTRSLLSNTTTAPATAASNTPKAPEYLPVKYLGSHVVDVNAELHSLANIVDHLVRRRNADVPEGWQSNCTRFRYYVSDGPIHCKAIAPKHVDEMNFSFKDAKIEFNSVLIYVDILPEQPSQLMVPYGFTDVVSWLSYRAYKKIMSIRPFGPQEVRILLKRQRERLERQRAGSIVDVDLTGGSITFDSQATVSMSPPGSVHSTPTSTKRRTLHLRDRSNSVGSPQQQRDRANSMASELGMSPTRSARPLNPKALAGKPFSVEVPLQQGTKLLIRRIAQELQVDAAHLALFIVNVTSIYAEDWEGDKWEASPISLACDFAHLKLLETLKKLNLNFKQNAKYCVFYQILPFPLVDNRGLDQRSKYKFTDYLIVDERIRYWRSLFLEHLCTTTSSSSSTAGAASGVATGAVGADITTIADAEQSTPKRSRTNSEGHSDAAVERSNSNTIASGASGKLQHLQPVPPREAAIRWPQPNRPPSEYDIPEVGRVSVMIPATYTMREVTSHLRYEIGIPANFRELDALKYADAPAARAQQQEEIVRILLMPNVGPSVISGTNKATCTDDLKITSDGAVKPSFPLLATVIRNNVINEILTGGKTMFIACRSEATHEMCHLYSVGLQHVTAEEAIFMRGRHPHIRSMALSVFGFKLCGKFAEPLPCREYKQGQGGGPFLSYVREDDTYESLARRLCAITGDSKEDWADLQLAITVKHPRGFRYDAVFLSQTQSTSTSGHGVVNSAVMKTSAATETKEEDTVAEEEEEEEEVEEDDYEYEIPRTPPSKKKKTSEGAAFATGAGFIGPSAGPVPNPDPNPGLDAEDADVHSLWDCFCEAYPNMCAAWNMPDVSSSTPTPFAFMGIQRSVANISAKNRSKRTGGGGIKIV